MSVLIAATVVALVAAAMSAVGFLVVSRVIPKRWLVADTDAAGALYATIGMVYAILIAIAAIAIWEPRTDASQSTDQEAASLIEASWSARALADPDREDMQRLIVSYLREATGPEWKSLKASRKSTAEGETRFTALRMRAETIEPSTDRQQTGYQAMVSQIATAADARRARIAAAGQGMPPSLWAVLIVGGLVSILFIYFFGLDRTIPNTMIMAVVGGMVALLLFVMYQVEYPFSRGFAVTPDSFDSAISQLSG